MKKYGVVKLDIPPHAYGIAEGAGELVTLVPGDFLIIEEKPRELAYDRRTAPRVKGAISGVYTCRSLDDLSNTRFKIPKVFVERMPQSEVDEILKTRLK